MNTSDPGDGGRFLVTIRRFRAVRRPARDDGSVELVADRLWAFGATAVVHGDDGELRAGFESEGLAVAAADSLVGTLGPGLEVHVAAAERGAPLVFGDGGHPSTLACLRALDAFVVRGRSVLDVGTGTGVLALRARSLGAARVVAVDVSSDAVEAARARGVVDVRVGSARDVDGTFDVVAANLGGVGAPLSIIDALAARVASGGMLILGGLLAVPAGGMDPAPLVARLARLGLSSADRFAEADWEALTFRDGAPARATPPGTRGSPSRGWRPSSG